MLFRKIVNLEEELETYKKIIKRYEKLINRIIDKCEQCNKIQYHGNPSIGFNAIKDLAESDIQEIYKLEDNLFLTNDE